MSAPGTPAGPWDDAMRLALTEAQAALTADDVPVGAVVLDAAGTVVGTGHNTRESHHDPTGHAEVVALRAAAAARGEWRLTGGTHGGTHDPSTRCAGKWGRRSRGVRRSERLAQWGGELRLTNEEGAKVVATIPRARAERIASSTRSDCATASAAVGSSRISTREPA